MSEHPFWERRTRELFREKNYLESENTRLHGIIDRTRTELLNCNVGALSRIQNAARVLKEGEKCQKE